MPYDQQFLPIYAPLIEPLKRTVGGWVTERKPRVSAALDVLHIAYREVLRFRCVVCIETGFYLITKVPFKRE